MPHIKEEKLLTWWGLWCHKDDQNGHKRQYGPLNGQILGPGMWKLHYLEKLTQESLLDKKKSKHWLCRKKILKLHLLSNKCTMRGSNTQPSKTKEDLHINLIIFQKEVKNEKVSKWCNIKPQMIKSNDAKYECLGQTNLFQINPLWPIFSSSLFGDMLYPVKALFVGKNHLLS